MSGCKRTTVPRLWPDTLRAIAEALLTRAAVAEATPLTLDLRNSGATDTPTLTIPTDVIFSAWRSLFPAERIMFLGARKASASERVSSWWDVTGGNRSIAHVQASPVVLGQTLLDFEATGIRVAGWLHSHPGRGPAATYPSHIDLAQDADLRRDFGNRVVGLIATEDGYVRAWGRALVEQSVKLSFRGPGIEPVQGEPHVYRLAVR